MLELSSAAAGGVALGGAAVSADSHHSNVDVVVESHDGTEIATTVYRPAGADADDPVPMILHSHGWSGSRTSGDGAFQAELDGGFGVLSFDQRGHGDSGGEAHVQDPDREGRDVIEVLDYVADLPWVRRDRGKAGTLGDGPAGDPVVFAMGGSYGGAYQLVGAFTEIRERGYTRFDALAPQITWFDLSASLAPQGVVRSAWVAALYTLGAGNVPEYVHRGFVYGTTTGQWPNGELPGEPDMDSRFVENGPSGFVADGLELDVPILFGQGTSDNLFNLNQAWHNFERALSDDAREGSAVVGYNGGHALPNALPPGRPMEAHAGTGAGACSGDGGFAELRLRFFEAVRDGSGDARDVVGSPYSLTTADGGRCVAVDALDDRTTLASGIDLAFSNDGAGNLSIERVDGAADRTVTTGDGFPGAYDPATVAEVRDAFETERGDELESGGGVAATSTGAGAPIHLELSGGDETVAGVPTLSATVTTVGVEQRVFAALSVGETPATARVVQNNMLPLREPEPVVGEERTIELPGVAVDVGADEQLYLTLSAVSDVSFGHGSTRTPGTVVLEDLAVAVPLVED